MFLPLLKCMENSWLSVGVETLHGAMMQKKTKNFYLMLLLIIYFKFPIAIHKILSNFIRNLKSDFFFIIIIRLLFCQVLI